MSRSSSDRSSSGLKRFINEKEYLTIIRESFFNPNFEICGNITVSGTGDEFIDIDFNTRDANENDVKYKKSLEEGKKHKLMCVHERYSDVMWHTHPDIIYPSVEDIAYILRKPHVSYSYIVTDTGYFRITAINKEPIVLNKTDSKIILDFLSEYYHFPETKKGRFYDKDRMNNYIRKLNTQINKIIETYGIEIFFEIKFYKYISK